MPRRHVLYHKAIGADDRIIADGGPAEIFCSLADFDPVAKAGGCKRIGAHSVADGNAMPDDGDRGRPERR